MADKCISSNPEIAGIGIRINFYVTILITALAPEREYTNELMDGLYKNSIIYGLGLVLTAVIQTLQEQLDLYHAIFAMQIILSLTAVYVYNQRRIILSSIDNFDMEIFVAVQTFSTTVFTVWILYVLIKGSNFGSQPECNHLVKYVFFFVSVEATATWLRVLLLFGIVICFWLLQLTFAATFMVYFHEGLCRKLRALLVGRTASDDGGLQGKIWRAFHKLVVIASAVFGILVVELTVQRNSLNIQPGEGIWGFGQIIALVLLCGSFVDVAVAFRRRRRTRTHSPKGIASEEAAEVVPKSEELSHLALETQEL